MARFDQLPLNILQKRRAELLAKKQELEKQSQNIEEQININIDGIITLKENEQKIKIIDELLSELDEAIRERLKCYEETLPKHKSKFENSLTEFLTTAKKVIKTCTELENDLKSLKSVKDQLDYDFQPYIAMLRELDKVSSEKRIPPSLTIEKLEANLKQFITDLKNAVEQLGG